MIQLLKKRNSLSFISKTSPFFLALLTGYSICGSRTYDRIVNACVILLLCFFYRYQKRNKNISGICLSKAECFLSFCFACGLEIMKYPDYLFSVIGSKRQLFKSCIMILGNWFFVAAIMKILMAGLLKYSSQKEGSAPSKSGTVWKWSSIAFFLIGIPYLYVYYPGGVFSDMFGQLTSYYAGTVTNHHPVLTTYLNGFIVQMGSQISDNFGIFLCNMVQYCLFSLVIGFLLDLLYQLTKSKTALLLGFAFYIFVPAFYHFSYLLVKVSLYAPIFVLYCCFIIRLLAGHEINRKSWLCFALLNILMLLVRKEGVYIVLISTGSLLFYYFKHKGIRRNLLVILAIIVCVNIGYHDVFLRGLKIPEGNIGDILGIPFLQTALYIRNAKEDVTEEEYRILQKAWGEHVEEIGELYNPTISDELKAKFHFPGNKAECMQYLNTYVQMGLRHPGIYAKALLAHISSYIFPEGYRSWYVYQDMDTLDERFKCPYLNVYSNPNAEFFRKLYHKYVSCWERMPLLSLTVCPGAYTWVYLLLFVLLFRLPEKKYLLAFIPVICVIGVCCISPVNGYTRYYIPVELTIPVYMAYVMRLYKMREGKNECNELGT